MHLSYATEETPLGTAGSVKNAEDALRTTPSWSSPGDALTDIDLSAVVQAHRDNGALVTVCLKRVPDPLEFGIVITDESQRIERFLEKPTWGQVFSDTVNTGIYVMEPEVFAHVARRRGRRLVRRRLPGAAGGRAPRSTATSPTATGRTSARTRTTCGCRPTCSTVKSTSRSPASRWRLASGSGRVPRSTRRPTVKGPVCIGAYAKVEAGAELREFTVLGDNVVVKEGAFLHRAVVHDNVFIGGAGEPARLRHRQEHRRHARGPDRGGRGRSATSASSRRRRSSPAV